MVNLFKASLSKTLDYTRNISLSVATASALIVGTGVFLAPQVLVAQSATPSSIAVTGNQRIATSTILTLAGLEVGQNYSGGELNAAVQRLNQSGFFKSVDFSVSGGRITIEVEENPTVNLIVFEGNKKLKDEALSGLIASQPRQTYSATRAEKDANEIANAYSASGRVLATVTPKIIQRNDNRVDLVFQVVEGRVTEIEDISFVGNRVFSDRRLRSTLATKQAGFGRAFVAGDTFIEDRLQLDKENLRNFYVNRGYVDFEVISTSTEITRERDAFLITFNLREGQLYNFGDVELTSDEAGVDLRALEPLIKIKSGSPYDPRKLETLLKEIDANLANARYSFVTAKPIITRDEEARTLNIIIDMVKGQRLFVERIDIEGNSSTLDSVIRRQFGLVEGDAFNQRAIQQATDRIRALGYFTSVDVQARPGTSPQSAIIDVNVQEQPTGSVGIGGSYNSSDGPILNLTIEENNFLGRGQSIKLGGTTGSDARNLEFSFSDPSFLDRNVSAGINLSYKSATPSYIPIETTTLIVSPSFGFPLGQYSRLNVAYKYEKEEIEIQEDDDGVESAISPTLLLDVGEQSKSSIVLSYSYDRRNSIIAPTGGYTVNLRQEFAGLGGDAEFSKTTAKFKTYNSLINDQVILTAELEAGAIKNFGSGSRVTDRFFLGGDQLRGFASYGIGPREAGAVGEGDPLGGNFYAVARLEASFPIGLPEEYGVFGGVFLDAGSVWGLDTISGDSTIVSEDRNFRAAIGVSLFWQTAIGPLRFNFSRPLKKEDYDEEENFRFTVDTRF